MMSMRRIEPLSIWWANVNLEVKDGDQYVISDDSFERPVLIIDNKAYLVFKITSRKGKKGYAIKDLESAGLSRPSTIRTDILVPLAESDLRHRMGRLSESDVKGLIEFLRDEEKPRFMGKSKPDDRFD